MTWEEIVLQIRKDPNYQALVMNAYFDADLRLNVDRFSNSEEFHETIKILSHYFPNLEEKKVLDLGAGNGISALSFALTGAQVYASEPDPSDTIGAGAIRELESIYKTGRVRVFQDSGENLSFQENFFDIVYVRQALHHAKDICQFVAECTRVLKSGGLLITVRDHLVYDEHDKQWFLDNHPLHKFYGGENAYTLDMYRKSFTSAGLKIVRTLKHFDSVINYFPDSSQYVNEIKAKREKYLSDSFKRKFFGFFENTFIERLYKTRLNIILGPVLDESNIPGRNISFISIKK